MTRDEIRTTLIESTIHVIGGSGMDKATTKAIASPVGINEVYIYRIFGGKGLMFAEAFKELDKELIYVIRHHFEVGDDSELPFKTRCHMLFSTAWDFMLGDKEKCLCYVRYLYSPYFKEFSADKHREAFAPLMKVMGRAFVKDFNVSVLMHHVLMEMLDFIARIYNGELAYSEELKEAIFNLLFASLVPSLIETKRNEVMAEI